MRIREERKFMEISTAWWRRAVSWFQVKRMERELRSSEKFQKQCEEIRCFNLAEMEEGYQARLKEKIRRQRMVE
jgi:hypothetical protein